MDMEFYAGKTGNDTKDTFKTINVKDKEFLSGGTAEDTMETGKTVSSTESASSSRRMVFYEQENGRMEEKSSGFND